ncbi:MAG: hypothetical protein ACHQ1G_01180 [Planctomycetota bacterium]
MRTVVLSLLLCGVSRAQSNDRYIDEVEAAIKGGGIAALHERIVLGLSDNPVWARRICAAAAECPLAAALHAKDDLKKAAEKIRQIGARASENNPESADAWSAEADSMYFHLRVLRACGEKTTTEDWLGVADALAKLHALKPDDPAAMERTVKYLREAKRAKGTDADILSKREDEVCKEGIKLFPKSALFLRIGQAAELDAVVALLAANGQKEAKPRLTALLANAVDDTAYNDAVTVAKQHFKKLGIKVDYRKKPGKYFEHLEYEVPKGERWETEAEAITQYGRDGRLLRRFSLDWFKRNINYTLGDTEYDGSNAKGMAMISERDVLSVIVKTESKSGIIKKALNRQIQGVQYFVIGGYDKDSDFNRFHTYLWKSEQRTWLTYRLWIIELQDLDGLDPEAQFVLDTFRETKYDGKDR